ncbi:MAG: outer membrane lipoprotein-sorting protein, partial [Candidatus Aminicenantes bacterium]
DKRKDVTQKYINESYKEMQKRARERKKAKDKNGEDDRRRHMDFSFDELFPFNEKNRGNYEFTLLEENSLEGTSVYVIDARAKQRTKDFFEGLFYIDRETWDILRAELRLAKNPGPLKVMNMNLDLKVLPEGYLTVRKAYVRIHVGLVVKNIRREVVDEYSDYEILEQ